MIYPSSRQISAHTAVEFCRFCGVFLSIFCKTLIPGILQCLPLGMCIPSIINILWNFKRQVMPTNMRACCSNFFITQSCAMHIMRIGFIRRAQTNDSFATNHARFILYFFSRFDCRLNCYRIMPVYIRYNVPAVCFKSFRGIIGEPSFNVPIDRDAIIIIETNQFTQL